MIVKEISEEQYTNFINNYPFFSVYQTKEYAYVMKKQDYNYLFVGGFIEDKIVAASLILTGTNRNSYYAYAPRGFLLDYNNKQYLVDFTKGIKVLLNKLGIGLIKISPIIVRNIINSDKKVIGTNPKFEDAFNNLKSAGYAHLGYNSLFEGSKPRFEGMLDISINNKKLFSNIKKEFRTKIRSAERQGIKIYKASHDEINLIYDEVKNKYSRDLKYLEDSYKHYNENDKMDFYYAKLDTSNYLHIVKEKYEKSERIASELNNLVMKSGNNSHKLLSKKIAQDKEVNLYKSRLIEAIDLSKNYPNGLVLATVLIAKHRSEIFTYMDGYNSLHKKFNAKHLLLWKIIEKYSALGYKRINFGGMINPSVNNPEYKGLNEFKFNFNCSCIEYIGDLVLVINSVKSVFYQLKKNTK